MTNKNRKRKERKTKNQEKKLSAKYFISNKQELELIETESILKMNSLKNELVNGHLKCKKGLRYKNDLIIRIAKKKRKK